MKTSSKDSCKLSCHRTWRPYLISDEKATEALSLTHFEFDKEQIYSNKVYRDLCELDATLYQQLKDYRVEHMTYST